MEYCISNWLLPYSSSSSELITWEYDVFLSFRGEDTRNNFTDHLFDALVERGIHTFKDDEKLGIGKPIWSEISHVIERSRMAVIILSRNFASSTWCLEELAKIVECMKIKEIAKMKVLPIFYDVDPSDVRDQKGAFADAFAKHDRRFKKNIEKVKTWRYALKQVANLSGRHLKDGSQSKFIKSIVEMIYCELTDTLSSTGEDNLVGMEHHVNKMYPLLQILSNDVRFVGICGMSGMGKTTLARVLFQRLQHQFRGSSFLENVSVEVKKHGLAALQEILLSDMKLKTNQDKWSVQRGINTTKNRLRCKNVLIVLDDVDEKEQLETLAGNCDWFGPGSRIIMTTKDRHLLVKQGVQNIYTIQGLNEYDDALDLQLFCQEAFCKPHCEEGFLDLCKDFVSYAGGHPLALKVLGSSLLGKSRDVWESARDRLKAIPSRDIQKKLIVSFDALGDTEKMLFLDIACFFSGEERERIVDILQGSGCYPNIDIETLVDKSLITISGKKLWMHNVLQRMGWEIVRCESPRRPGKRSRLWHRDDIHQVLSENTGTHAVEGIMLNANTSFNKEQMNAEAFLNMKILKLLKICNMHLPAGLRFLPNNLRLMEWHEFPLMSMPSSFEPENLVELIMPRSHFKHFPKGLSNLNRLKLFDLSNSQNLITTPDFSGFPNLERLILQGCTRLNEVHQSVGNLNRLILLNLRDCKCLHTLPSEINLESLEVFILSGCSRLKKFSKIGNNMKCLLELYLDGTSIEELPSSIQNLTSLTLLNLQNCKNFSSPTIISSVTSLKSLTLSGCKGRPSKSWHWQLSFILSSIGVLLVFQHINLSTIVFATLVGLACCSLVAKHPESAVKSFLLPESFFGLTSLVALDLSDCDLLDGVLPNDLSCLSSLQSLNLSRNNFTTLPDSICKLSKLEFLYLDNCIKLQSLPSLPVSTQFVMARGCNSLKSYSNQIIVWTSRETGFTIINCLHFADNEDKVSEVSLLDVHFQPLWQAPPAEVYPFHHGSKFYGVFPQTGIPKWFSHQKCGSSVSISLPTDLSKDSTWRGIALYIVFGVDKSLSSVSPGQDSSYIHELKYKLDMNGGLADGTIVLNVHKAQVQADSYRLCLYMSQARLGENINLRSCISPSITTNSPSVEIKACGARILYEQDMVEFIQIFSQRNFWCPDLRWGTISVQQAARKPRQSRGQVDFLDFDGRSVHNFCCPTSVIKLAAHYSRDPSVTFDIPQYWYNDSNWMGLVLCACFSQDNPDSHVPNCHLKFSLKTDVGFLDRFQMYCPTKEDLMLLKRGGFEWWCYIPRGSFPDWLNHSTLIEASIAADYPNLTMEYCAFQLLYPNDLVKFNETIRHAMKSFSYVISQLVIANEKEIKPNLEEDAMLSTTSSPKEESHRESPSVLFDPTLKDKGKGIVEYPLL